MTRKKVEGICHICGLHGELSFEHVPPSAAFNNRPVRIRSMMQILESGLDDERGRTQQRGAGSHTLCVPCNNATGRWYGSAYVDWACQALGLVESARTAPSLYLTYHLYPLRVIKQVVCMFFSANGPEFREAQTELVKFVLDKRFCGLPARLRIHAFLTQGRRSRTAGVTGVLDTATGALGIHSEITFPPFGFVLSFESRPPDPRLVEITHFAWHGYNDWKHISLRMPVLPVYTAYPGDYRDFEAVQTTGAVRDSGSRFARPLPHQTHPHHRRRTQSPPSWQAC